MPGGVQLDVPDPAAFDRVTPVARQHRGRVGLACLVAYDAHGAPSRPSRKIRFRRPGGPSRPSALTPADRNGSVRRDDADFGSFSTDRPPADTRLLAMDNVLVSSAQSDQRRPAISPRRKPVSANSQVWPSRSSAIADSNTAPQPRCRCRDPCVSRRPGSPGRPHSAPPVRSIKIGRRRLVSESALVEFIQKLDAGGAA